MLDLAHASMYFELLYNKIDGYSVSHDARKEINQESASELLYGELPFITCKSMIKKANAKSDGVFFDLGSGTGRIVLAAHMIFDFKKVVGVELLRGLHDKACEVRDHFYATIYHQIEEFSQNREIELINESLFNVDLSEADVIFMNHPFKDREMFKKLEEKFLNELKPQTKIITIIRPLENKNFKKLASAEYDFSWGKSTAFFYEV